MFCTSCGMKLNGDEKFCRNCGNAIITGNGGLKKNPLFNETLILKNKFTGLFNLFLIVDFCFIIFGLVLMIYNLLAGIGFVIADIVFSIIATKTINYKTIIDNNEIYLKKNGSKKYLGSLSQIDSYAIQQHAVTVFLNNSNKFSYDNKGKVNVEFTNYLQENYNEVVRVARFKILVVFYPMLFSIFFSALLCNLNNAILFILYLAILVLMIFILINDYKIELVVKDGRITYKKIMTDKQYSVNDITKIQYSRVLHYANVARYYNVVGYIGDEIVFKNDMFQLDKIELLKKIVTKTNPNCQFVHIKY